jgi:hypothetical protein
MGRSSSYLSPSKKARNMTRLVSYLKYKLNVPTKILSFSQPMILSISPPPRPLSFSKPVLTDIPPVTLQGPFPPATITVPKHVPVNYPSNSLIMDLTRQQTKSNIYNNPVNSSIHSNIKQYDRKTPVLDRWIPQLDGGTSDMSINNLNQHHQPQPVPYPLRCSSCLKIFESEDDFKWHKQTQIGREDCSILKSMLAS